MLFGKKTHLIGLDIGSRTIKLGEITDSKNGYSLKKFGTIDIAPGLIEEGVVKDPEIVAESIRELGRLNTPTVFQDDERVEWLSGKVHTVAQWHPMHMPAEDLIRQMDLPH